MSRDSIRHAVLCAERRGRTPARSIDTALLARPYTHNCDYLIINPVSLRHSFSVRKVCRCGQTLFANRRSKSKAYSLCVAGYGRLLSAMSVSVPLGLVYLISEKNLIRDPGNQE